MKFTSDSLSLDSGLIDDGGLPITATVNPATETLTLTFTADFVVLDTEPLFVTQDITLSGAVIFPACGPGSGYVNEAEITFDYDASYNPLDFTVAGEACAPSAVPAVDYVEYIPELGAVTFGIQVPDVAVAPGSVITITYPQDKFQIDSATMDLFSSLTGIDTGVHVATAVASDGVITITFVDFEVPEETSLYVSGWMDASLSTEACDPDAGSYIIEIGRLFFVASPGGSFSSYIDNILCGAAPASKTGVLSADGTYVVWTIDTGDIIGSGTIQEGMILGGTTFDCSTLVITPAYDGIDVDYTCDEEFGYGFTVNLTGAEVVRATITVTGVVDPEFTLNSYVNCAIISARFFDNAPTATAASSSAGHGDMICAEVFPAGGGHFISNTASADTVYPGDSLTYTVNARTTTQLWWQFDLKDALPAGFEATSITCTILPVEFAVGDCVIQDDNTITVALQQADAESPTMDLANITIVIEGTVTAAPGTELVTEACSQRSLDIPGIPLYALFLREVGGTVCASTSTMVLQPVVPVTPTPTPTDPATPSPTDPATPSPTEPATPAATPTTPATPEPTVAATSAVTGLPETGSGNSSGITMLLGALVAGVMVAGAIGLRTRTLRV